MGFFLGLLSSGQKFHFCSADSCYLHKLACLSRNLLNEQEIAKKYGSLQKDSAMIRKIFTEEIDSNPYRSRLPFVHFCIDQQSVDAQTLLYQRTTKYTLFDGLAYNTCGYFASCVVFSRAPQGRGKIRAMSKMFAHIIC